MSEEFQEEQPAPISDEVALMRSPLVGEWLPSGGGNTTTTTREVAVARGSTPPNKGNTAISTEAKDANETETEDDIPDEFLCPITQELMTDPVFTPYGHSYQRSAIIEWLVKPGNNCPMTRQPLGPWQLFTNQTLRCEIRQWQIQRGEKNPISAELVETEEEKRISKKQKETFLLFTRVLVKYLEQKDQQLLGQVKSIIRDCAERSKRGEPGYESVTNCMRFRLKNVVPETYWNRAEVYLRQLLRKKRNDSSNR